MGVVVFMQKHAVYPVPQVLVIFLVLVCSSHREKLEFRILKVGALVTRLFLESAVRSISVQQVKKQRGWPSSSM